MPALSFKPQLIKAACANKKPGTIRQLRKRTPLKAGDTLYFFTGMRTKNCIRHASKKCVGVYPITLDLKFREIKIDGIRLRVESAYLFAMIDIQGTHSQFWDFFKAAKYTRPLVYIIWDLELKNSIDRWLDYQKPIRKIYYQLPASS